MNTTIENNGKLTAYGFACGYVQFVENLTLQKELYREHNVYHVRSLYNNTPELNTKFDGSHSHKFIIWETYETLTEAKKIYNKIK
jgi:hypothetical protein